MATDTTDGMLLVPIGNLALGQCRWPVDYAAWVPGKHLFCGRATGFGRLYCHEHHKLSRQPPKENDDG
jgi:hypothetical protein